jgi:hypothetical protein
MAKKKFTTAIDEELPPDGEDTESTEPASPAETERTRRVRRHKPESERDSVSFKLDAAKMNAVREYRDEMIVSTGLQSVTLSDAARAMLCKFIADRSAEKARAADGE